jgi:cysteine synthase A
MARRLARDEGIFAGVSSGANVAAAIQVARGLGQGATIATIIIDSGLRCLSTDVYRGGAGPDPETS